MGTEPAAWVVRPVTGQAAQRTYRCPGCDQEIGVGVPHVVVWPAEVIAGEPVDLRRHWHTPCWRRLAGVPAPKQSAATRAAQRRS